MAHVEKEGGITKVKEIPAMEAKKCGCGKTKNADGTCDGSHAVSAIKSVPFDKITIRVISTQEPQKTKNLYVPVANNKALLKRMGFAISDPQYEAKMKAYTEKKPYTESVNNKKPVTA